MTKRYKTGAILNAITYKVYCQKFWIEEQFQNKPEKSNFFKFISSTKKIQNNSRNLRIGYPEILCMKFDTSPQLFSTPLFN